MLRMVCGVIVSVVLAGCGGVSEQRVSNIEQQVKKLQEGTPAPAAAGGDKELATRMDGFEAVTNERLKKIEEMIDFLQKGVAEAAAKPAPAAASAGAENAWADVDALLGVEEVGVEADGDNYVVRRGWLLRQVQAAAGKGPKLAPAKPTGVGVKGVKPKSFIDQLGIKNGDVITTVNETPVASVDELAAALKRSASPLSVKVLRKKKETVLQYTLKD
ncbi:MAG: serine protease [Deltaproteobacteria bacterium]|nr:serine protease [Deltaproteobacteria bacterium]